MNRTSLRTLLVASAAATAMTMAAGTASAQGVAEQLVKEFETMDAAQREAFQDALRTALQVPEKGKERTSLEINGQVNKAFMYMDDGDSSDVAIVDGDFSSTRFRMLGQARINEDVTAGFFWEVEYQSDPSNAVTPFAGSRGGSNGAGSPTFVERHTDLYFQSKTLGTLRLGQGSEASDGIAESDLTGTEVVMLTGLPDLIGGGIAFRAAGDAPGAAGTGPTVGATHGDFDGSRIDRVRYDTPKLGGLVTLSTSFDNRGSAAVGAFADGKIAGHQWRLRGGYDWSGRGEVSGSSGGGTATTVDNSWAVSGSMKTTFGLTFAASFGMGEASADGADDPWNAYGKVGYQFNATSLGRTAIAIDYMRGDNVEGTFNTATTSNESTSWGIGLVQNIDVMSGEVYATARRFSFDTDGPGTTSYDDVTVGMVGSRIKF